MDGRIAAEEIIVDEDTEEYDNVEDVRCEIREGDTAEEVCAPAAPGADLEVI